MTDETPKTQEAVSDDYNSLKLLLTKLSKLPADTKIQFSPDLIMTAKDAIKLLPTFDGEFKKIDAEFEEIMRKVAYDLVHGTSPTKEEPTGLLGNPNINL